MAIEAEIDPAKGDNYVVPDLLSGKLPPGMIGFAFAAIAIGAIIPVAIMSIAAANLFTRSIYKEYLRPGATDYQEARMARLVSLVVKAGALVFVVSVDTAQTLDLQLLGGVWILQTLPAVIFGLYTDWLDQPRAASGLAGWHARGHDHVLSGSRAPRSSPSSCSGSQSPPTRPCSRLASTALSLRWRRWRFATATCRLRPSKVCDPAARSNDCTIRLPML